MSLEKVTLFTNKNPLIFCFCFLNTILQCMLTHLLIKFLLSVKVFFGVFRGSGGGGHHLYNPDLVRQRGLEHGWPQPLWWLITIHLAAAVNIDSSRDFQFEPVDMLWNITMCVQVRGEIGREGDRSGPQGRGPLTRSSLNLIYQFNSKDQQLLLSVWCYWVVHELIFLALNYWVLLFIFCLSHLLILVLIVSYLCSCSWLNHMLV